ncbi:helix-turn-helix domain-containing protein [Mycobacterium sp.]|uniref:helix-turn-helix domain-containing protein n=1 Tax=Mycobacterium sp. TaxID=1785 RepID=UPI003F9BF4BE
MRASTGKANGVGTNRANGTKFGRRKKIADPSHIATARRMKADGHTGRDIAKYLEVSRATLYRYLAAIA